VAFQDDRVLVELEDPLGGRFDARESRLHFLEIAAPQLPWVAELLVAIVAGEVVVPGGAELAGRLWLALLGDVVLLHGKLFAEAADVGRSLFDGFVGAAGRPEERGAVDALERLFHALRGEDAAVVVLQDPLRAAPERVESAQRDEAQQDEPRGERELREDQLGPQRQARLSWSRKDTTWRSNSSPSRKSRVTTEPRRTCFHHGSSDLPTMMW